MPSLLLKNKNKYGKTPGQLFSEEHKQLLKEVEAWMKDTANYCMIVAALIATVMFAAAFTVPGSNNSDEGTPIMIKLNAFAVFVTSDAVALFTSIVSIIMFLSILTSRYTEDDFLVSLPAKLLCGLTALFISIVSMLVAFAATFFLVYNYHRLYEPKVIAAFAGLPVALFAILHFMLWLDTARSTCSSKFLFRPGKHRIYKEQIRHNRGAGFIFGLQSVKLNAFCLSGFAN
ncbi:ankyrin repeat-containing protein NPR4-like [Lycium barbarum]|uniref:ankyrin repeat-containing protein NPR4-like n=1 Tax=Lycium barbarum TaxID=112863 RepID=UPI00293F03F9|nr:ankyrin repeat-containing protein NPR4-like [Lycium barbarum]